MNCVGPVGGWSDGQKRKSTPSRHSPRHTFAWRGGHTSHGSLSHPCQSHSSPLTQTCRVGGGHFVTREAPELLGLQLTWAGSCVKLRKEVIIFCVYTYTIYYFVCFRTFLYIHLHNILFCMFQNSSLSQNQSKFHQVIVLSLHCLYPS